MADHRKEAETGVVWPCNQMPKPLQDHCTSNDKRMEEIETPKKEIFRQRRRLNRRMFLPRTRPWPMTRSSRSSRFMLNQVTMVTRQEEKEELYFRVHYAVSGD